MITSRSFLPLVVTVLSAGLLSCSSTGKATSTTGADTLSPVYENAQPQLIARQFKFTEGPAADAAGNIYFTDQPNDKIWKYDTEGKLTQFLDKTGRANGLYFDRNGNLIACADDVNELLSFTPDGKVTILMDNYLGKK
ncbi:SMP-30/gluconolactonase/LRE family protein [Paraflavitalea speifideaquila]|uniref:SMP-30/gluconolactonase/LRE family protein n=1 Tax=Paraflavitalea speifideaquila TaxID=3076558 RepID=UPI0028E77286|nr:SMP-30/gluconolactonase/LRE family protein [Paraflavitalea speifideiaquila]